MNKINISGKTKYAIKIGLEKENIKTKIDNMIMFVLECNFFLKKKNNF